MFKKKLPFLILTGSSGLLGSFIKPYFSEKYNIITIDKKKLFSITSNEDNLIDLIAKLSHYPIYAVIHLAAFVHRRNFFESSKIKSKIYFSNVEITRVLAKLAITLKIEKFIFASTTGIYGPGNISNENPFDTFSPTIPYNLYSASKLSAEYALQSIYESCPEKLVILRISSVITKNPKGSLRLLSLFSKFSLPFPLLSLVDNHIPTRSFAKPNFICWFISKILEGSISSGEIYNISSKDFTVESLLNYFCEKKNKPIIFNLKINKLLLVILINSPLFSNFFRPLLLNHIVNKNKFNKEYQNQKNLL